MALSDRVQERLPAHRLVQLTNGNKSDNSINTTLLGYATGDVEAMLEVYAGVAYDETDARIVAIAVQGVERLLARWKGQNERVDQMWDEWVQMVKNDLRRVTGNNRLRPKTSSLVYPTSENPSGNTNQRPDIDRHGPQFDDVIPN